MRLQQMTAGLFRQSRFMHMVVKVSLVVLIGLFFVGGYVGVSVKGAHAQSAVEYSVSHTAHTDTPNNPPAGSYNWFPYPACTWWADQRYHELHGVYVPWRTQANAWEWTARAQQFGWKVSTKASMGTCTLLASTTCDMMGSITVWRSIATYIPWLWTGLTVASRRNETAPVGRRRSRRILPWRAFHQSKKV